jgi:hypothetical protein
VVPSRELAARIHARWPIEPRDREYRGEVAERHVYADGAGEIGFISSVSQPFCGDCSRARISSDGSFYTCLFATRAPTCARRCAPAPPTTSSTSWCAVSGAAAVTGTASCAPRWRERPAQGRNELHRRLTVKRRMPKSRLTHVDRRQSPDHGRRRQQAGHAARGHAEAIVKLPPAVARELKRSGHRTKKGRCSTRPSSRA